VMGEITPDVEALHMIIGLGNFEATGSTGGNTYDLAQRIMSSDWLEAHDREVAEKAWDDCVKKVRSEMRAIPSCGDGQGGQMFDLLPLGPNESSESGARIAVFEALDELTNPCREGATE